MNDDADEGPASEVSLQLILGTDRSNPCFCIYSYAGAETLHVYYGLELLESVPDDREHFVYKLLVARLYNAGVKARELQRVFAVDRKTMQRWPCGLAAAQNAIRAPSSPRRGGGSIGGLAEQAVDPMMLGPFSLRMSLFFRFGLSAAVLIATVLSAETASAAPTPTAARANSLVGDRIELGSPVVIAQYFIPIPDYETGRGSARERIEANKRSIHDMHEFGVDAASLDVFDNDRDKGKALLFAEAVREYNREHPGAPFAYFLNLDMPPSNRDAWPAKNIIDIFTRLNGPGYALLNGRPILSTWLGWQKKMPFWTEEVCRPLRARGLEPFLYCYFLQRVGGEKPRLDLLLREFHEVRAAGCEIGFYHWATREAERSLPEALALHEALAPVGFRMTPAFGSSFFATVNSGGGIQKPNAGSYNERHGYESTDAHHARRSSAPTWNGWPFKNSNITGAFVSEIGEFVHKS